MSVCGSLPVEANQQAVAPLAVPQRTDDSARQLLQAHRRARGGDALDGLKNWQASGTLREGLDEYRIDDYAMAPNLFRRERVQRVRGREIKVIEGYDGERGWLQDLSRDRPLPEPLRGEELTAMLARADFLGPLVDGERDGRVFQYLGEDRAGGRENYILRMFEADGSYTDFYLKRDNFLLTRITRPQRVGDAVVNHDTYISRYRRVGGVWMPKAFQFMLGRQSYGKLEYDSLSFNEDLDRSLFEVPEVAERWLRQPVR